MTKRAFTELLTELGYRFDHQAKHEIWACGNLEIGISHGTGDVPRHLVTQLRKHHPDHPALKRGPGAGKGKHHKTFHPDRHPRPLVAVPALPVVEKPKPPRAPDRTQCVGCGRPWLSDVSPVGRPCPKCGGEVVIGKRDDREFRWERAA